MLSLSSAVEEAALEDFISTLDPLKPGNFAETLNVYEVNSFRFSLKMGGGKDLLWFFFIFFSIFREHGLKYNGSSLVNLFNNK